MPPILLYKYTVIIFNKSVDKVGKITDNIFIDKEII